MTGDGVAETLLVFHQDGSADGNGDSGDDASGSGSGEEEQLGGGADSGTEPIVHLFVVFGERRFQPRLGDTGGGRVIDLDGLQAGAGVKVTLPAGRGFAGASNADLDSDGLAEVLISVGAEAADVGASGAVVYGVSEPQLNSFAEAILVGKSLDPYKLPTAEVGDLSRQQFGPGLAGAASGPRFVATRVDPQRVSVCEVRRCWPLVSFSASDEVVFGAQQAVAWLQREATAFVALTVGGTPVLAALSTNPTLVADGPVSLAELRAGTTRGRLIDADEGELADAMLSTSDVDGDGVDDVVAYLPGGAGAAAILLRAGEGTTNLSELDGRNGFIVRPSDGGTLTGAQGVGDLNEDGYGDVVISLGSGAVLLLFGQPADFGFPAVVDPSRIPGSQPGVMLAAAGTSASSLAASGLADVSGDGLYDAVFGRQGSDTAYLLLGRKRAALQLPKGAPSVPALPATARLPTLFSQNSLLEFVDDPRPITSEVHGVDRPLRAFGAPFAATLSAEYDGTVVTVPLPSSLGPAATAVVTLLQEQVVWLGQAPVRFLVELRDRLHSPNVLSQRVALRASLQGEVVEGVCVTGQGSGRCIAELSIPQAWFDETDDVLVSTAATAGAVTSNQFILRLRSGRPAFYPPGAVSVQLPTGSVGSDPGTFVRVFANGGSRGVGSIAVRLAFDTAVVDVGALEVESPLWTLTDSRQNGTIVVVGTRQAAATTDPDDGEVFRLRLSSSESSGPPSLVKADVLFFSDAQSAPIVPAGATAFPYAATVFGRSGKSVGYGAVAILGEVRALVATVEHPEMFNTVPFSNATTPRRNALAVALVSSSGQETPVTHGLACLSSVPSVLTVAADCSGVAVTPGASAGHPAVQVSVSTASGLVATVTVSVWQPVLPAQLVPDRSLLRRVGPPCGGYHESALVRASATFTTSSDGTVGGTLSGQRVLDVTHLVSSALHVSNATLLAMDAGETAAGLVRVRGKGRGRAEVLGPQGVVRPVALDIGVAAADVVELRAHAYTGLHLDAIVGAREGLTLAQAVQTTRVSYIGQQAKLAVFAILADGSTSLVPKDVSLTYDGQPNVAVTSSPPFPAHGQQVVFLGPVGPAGQAGSVSWRATCHAVDADAGAKLVSSGVIYGDVFLVQTALRVTVEHSTLQVAGASSAAVPLLSQAGFPLSTRLRVFLTWQEDGVGREVDVTGGSMTTVTPDGPMFRIVPTDDEQTVFPQRATGTGSILVEYAAGNPYGASLRSRHWLEVVDVQSASVIAAPYPEYEGSRQHRVRSLQALGDTDTMQLAMLGVSLRLSNGAALESWAIQQADVQLSSDAGVQLLQRQDATILSPARPVNSLDVTVAYSSLEFTRVRSSAPLVVTVASSAVLVTGLSDLRLVPSGPADPAQVSTESAVRVLGVFSDGTKRQLIGAGGEVVLPGFLQLSVSNAADATVVEGSRVAALRSGSVPNSLIASGPGVPEVSVPFVTNVRAPVGGAELGSAAGLAIDPFTAGDTRPIAVRVNAAAARVGSALVTLTYDPASIDVVAVTRGPDWQGQFVATTDAQRGLVRLGGILPGLQRDGPLDVARVTVRGRKRGISTVTVAVDTLASVDGEPIRSQASYAVAEYAVVVASGRQRRVPVPGRQRRADADCTQRPRGDANDNCVFQLDDVKLLQSMLAAEFLTGTPSPAFRRAAPVLDANMDGEVNADDVGYFLKVIFGEYPLFTAPSLAWQPGSDGVVCAARISTSLALGDGAPIQQGAQVLFLVAAEPGGWSVLAENKSALEIGSLVGAGAGFQVWRAEQTAPGTYSAQGVPWFGTRVAATPVIATAAAPGSFSLQRTTPLLGRREGELYPGVGTVDLATGVSLDLSQAYVPMVLGDAPGSCGTTVGTTEPGIGGTPSVEAVSLSWYWSVIIALCVLILVAIVFIVARNRRHGQFAVQEAPDFVVTVLPKSHPEWAKPDHPFVGQGYDMGFAVQSYGTGDYVLGPELSLTRGREYRFKMADTKRDQGLYIAYEPEGGSPGRYEFTAGVKGAPAAGKGTLIFKVPLDAPDVLYYACSRHSHMGYRLRIGDKETGDGSVTLRGSVFDTRRSSSAVDQMAMDDYHQPLTVASAERPLSQLPPPMYRPPPPSYKPLHNVTRFSASGPASGLRVAPEYIPPPSYRSVSTAHRSTTPALAPDSGYAPRVATTHGSHPGSPFADPTGFGSLSPPTGMLPMNDSYATAVGGPLTFSSMGPKRQSLRITGDRSDRGGI